MINRIFSPFRKFSGGLFSYLETPEIRRKIFFTIGIVLVFRFLAAIPLPGIDIEVYNLALGSDTGTPFSSLLTLATGGSIDTPSLVAIGIGAYINASIAIQLLTSVIPKLEELQKEGENGRRVISQITRILTVPLSVLQGFVVYTLIQTNSQAVGDSGYVISDMVAGMTSFDIIVMITAITAGSLILMWLSELITENGIGNGSSIIIMAGILASLPGFLSLDISSALSGALTQIQNGNFEILVTDQTLIFMYLFIIGTFGVIGLIVYVEQAIRKITVQYARRVRGTETVQSSYLPLKINQSGVMPIIFASALLTFPSIIGQVVQGVVEPTSSIYTGVSTLLSQPIFIYGTWQYTTFYFVMIILFTFFYSFIVMKPEDTADNLRKSGGFIPGIRPGAATRKYITHVMLRLATVGSIFLGMVAIIPNVVRLSEVGQQFSILTLIGGSSILIIVSVIVDTYRQMKSMRVSRSYEVYK